jgi:hypothetical protein
LRAALGPHEAVPFAFALARNGIAQIDHDCPMAGRTLFKMSPYFTLSR